MTKLNYSLLDDFIKSEKEKYAPKVEKTDQEKLQTQINNANTKLASQGLDTVEDDDRWWLERALNTRKNQGFIGDIFEILGRPQQALYSQLESMAESYSKEKPLTEALPDLMKAMYDGWAGNTDISGKDLMTSENTYNAMKKIYDDMPEIGKTVMDAGAKMSPVYKGDSYLDVLNEVTADRSDPQKLAESLPAHIFDFGKYDDLFNYITKYTDWSDVYGLTSDFLLDPIDWAIAITTGGTGTVASVAADATKTGAKAVNIADTVGDAVKVSDKVRDASKIANAVNYADNVGDIATAGKIADNVGDIATAGKTANVMDLVGDSAKTTNKVTNLSYPTKITVKKSASDFIFESAGKGIKKVANTADDLFENILGKFDNGKGIFYDSPSSKVANMGKKFDITPAKYADELGDSGKIYKYATGSAAEKTGLLESYKLAKETVTNAFDKAKSVPKKVMDAIRKNNTDQGKAAAELSVVSKKYSDNMNRYANEMFADKSSKFISDYDNINNVDDYVKKLDNDMLDLYEYENYDRTSTIRKVVNEAQEDGVLRKTLDDADYDKLNSVAKTVNKSDKGYNLSVKVDDDGYIVLEGDWKKAFDKEKGFDFSNGVALNGKKNNVFGIDDVINKKAMYTDDDIANFKKLQAKIKKGNIDLKKGRNTKEALFAKLYKETNDVFTSFNDVIRKNFGLAPTDKISGYVRHAVDEDVLALMSNGKARVEGNFKGNTRALGKRKYDMSVKEANYMFKENCKKELESLTDASRADMLRLAGEDGMFKTGMLASMDDYLQNVPKSASEAAKYNDILINATFGDYDTIENIERKISKASRDGNTELAKKLKMQRAAMLDDSPVKVIRDYDQVVPKNFTKLSGEEVEQLINKLEKYANQYGSGEFNNLASYLKLDDVIDNVAIQNDVLRVLKMNVGGDVNQFVKWYDKWLNDVYKKFKVLSPTFQSNNLFGNMSNMFLAGIDVDDMAKYYPKAYKAMKEGPELYAKVFSEGIESLSDSQKKTYQIWKEFTDSGIIDIAGKRADDLYDLPEGLAKLLKSDEGIKGAKWYDKLPAINAKMNQDFDTMSRLVTFMKGKDSPSFLAKLDVADAAEAVRKVNFDPSMITEFENSVMKRLMPFYTFTKKNLAFQFDNLTKNGNRYYKMNKAYNKALDAATGGNSENVADYLKESMYIPIPVKGKDGNYTFIRATLPMSTLNEATSDPLGFGVNALTPLIKLPIELATNTNAFTGLPIEKFEGEKSNSMPFDMSKKGEHILSSVSGFDVPLKNLGRFLEGVKTANDNDEGAIDAVGRGLTEMTTISANTETDKTNRMYEHLEDVENTIKKYEQQGYEFSTINELKQAQSANQRAVNEVLAQYAKIHGNSYNKKDPYQAYLDSLGMYSTTTETEDLWEYFGIE